MYHIFHWLAIKKDYQKYIKKHVTALILKLTYDQKPETFYFILGLNPNHHKSFKINWRI